MTIQQPERASLRDDLVLNALQHPIFIVQGDGTVGQANAEAEEFFGASKSTLSRTTIESLLPFASPVLSVIQQVRKSGMPVKEYRMDLTSPRLGPDKIVDVYASPLTQDSEQVVVMFQERGTAEKIAQHLVQRSAARSVSGLASMLAHEIKNPLSGIRGAAQLLEEGASSEDRDLTRLIREETDRIVNLVDRMEIFSDESPRPRSAVNIHVILDHVQTVAAHGFAKHIRFTKQYDPSLPPVMVNRDQIIQVFLNLIKNAAEALGPVDGGEILLSTAFKSGIRLSVSGVDEKISLPLEFSVQDNGPGVPPDIMPHLFDPFITTKINGSGLGLPLVSKLVGEHGGMVECESNPKRTVFRILMPAFRESSDERQHRQADAP